MDQDSTADGEVGASGPLVGIRVLELGSTIAGPYSGRLLADFGADVIKVEPPSGDPVRGMGRHDQGESLYAASILRNKKLISVDFKTPDGMAIVKDLVGKSDIVIENFRPGTMERLGLGYDDLAALNPGIIMVRISGYGQTGPYKDWAGYGVVAEAVGGVREMTGDPDRPPARVAVALTDELTAVYAVYGAMMALMQRQRTGRGQCIDAALYEAAFGLMEPHVPAYERLGVVPTRTGSGLPNAAPNNLYPTGDGSHVHLAANSDVVFERLSKAMGMADLPRDERFANQTARVANKDALDAIITEWTQAHTTDAVEETLIAVGVPASRVFTMADIFDNAHYRARDMLVQAPHHKFGTLTMAGVVPKLSETPGAVRWSGGDVGSDTRAVLSGLLGLSDDRIAELEAAGAVFSKQAD